MRTVLSWQILALASALFAALTAILGKVGVSGIDSNLATLIRTVVVLLVSILAVTLGGGWKWDPAIGMRPVVFLVLSGVATGLSWLCYWRAMQAGPASSVAPVEKSSIIFTMILAIIVLGEALTWKMALGGGLVAAGVLVLAL